VPAGGRWGAGGGDEAYLRGAPVISVGGAARSVARGRRGRRGAICREGKAWAARCDLSRGEGGRAIDREGKVKGDRPHGVEATKFCDMWATKSNLPSPNRVVLEKPLFFDLAFEFCTWQNPRFAK
jgi:hypothetical protein